MAHATAVVAAEPTYVIRFVEVDPHHASWKLLTGQEATRQLLTGVRTARVLSALGSTSDPSRTASYSTMRVDCLVLGHSTHRSSPCPIARMSAADPLTEIGL